MDYQHLITFIMEMLGTIAFASSGAMTAVEKNMDIFGVSVLGVVTATGGGLIRDLVLGITPPGMFRDPVYALAAIVTSCCLFWILYAKKEWLSGAFRTTYDKIMLAFDAVGLGIFTAVGISTAVQNGYRDNLFLLVFVGTITGVGGGILRDVLAGEPPYIFVKHVYACASIAGALFYILLQEGFGQVTAMFGASALVILLRFLAAYYKWNLPRLKGSD